MVARAESQVQNVLSSDAAVKLQAVRSGAFLVFFRQTPAHDARSLFVWSTC